MFLRCLKLWTVWYGPWNTAHYSIMVWETPHLRRLQAVSHFYRFCIGGKQKNNMRMKFFMLICSSCIREGWKDFSIKDQITKNRRWSVVCALQPSQLPLSKRAVELGGRYLLRPGGWDAGDMEGKGKPWVRTGFFSFMTHTHCWVAKEATSEQCYTLAQHLLCLRKIPFCSPYPPFWYSTEVLGLADELENRASVLQSWDNKGEASE